MLGRDEAERVVAAEHMPSAVAGLIGEWLREARDQLGLDGFAMLRIDSERTALIDGVGGCERIVESPTPLAYRIEIRRFLVLFIAAVPFARVQRISWLTPIATMLFAAPLLAVNRIGADLQNPLSRDSLNHLPLDDICATIEGNLMAMLEQPVNRRGGEIARHDPDAARA